MTTFHTRKARNYKSEWNNAAIEVKRKEEERENSYHFTHLSQGPINSNPYLNQKEKTKDKKRLFAGRKKKIKK